jgi:hypothetical protein
VAQLALQKPPFCYSARVRTLPVCWSLRTNSSISLHNLSVYWSDQATIHVCGSAQAIRLLLCISYLSAALLKLPVCSSAQATLLLLCSSYLSADLHKLPPRDSCSAQKFPICVSARGTSLLPLNVSYLLAPASFLLPVLFLCGRLYIKILSGSILYVLAV